MLKESAGSVAPASPEAETIEENDMAVRPSPQVMRLTDAAAARVRDILAKADRPVVGVRVGVTKGGCAGMTYKVEYADAVKPGDEVVERDGARVLIDPTAVLFLLGTEMDYRVDKLTAQFVFKNPNETSACGCGESVQLTPADQDGAPTP
jgi:iron-sulfur cluster assembly protein